MALGIQWANGDQDVRCSWSLTCAITHILKNTMLEARTFLKQSQANVKQIITLEHKMEEKRCLELLQDLAVHSCC